MNERNENADIALMTEIATLYYTEGETQEVIANRLGISRVKAGRLLKRAQAEGIVDVRVRQHPAVSAEIEQALKRRFGIKRALIALDHADADGLMIGLGLVALGCFGFLARSLLGARLLQLLGARHLIGVCLLGGLGLCGGGIRRGRLRRHFSRIGAR